MRRIVFVLTLLVCTLPSLVSAQTDEDPCADYQAADKELNVVYKRVLEAYREDKVFLEAFKKAQRAWLAFRDAHLEAVYPDADKQASYGSAYVTCDCGEQTDLIRERITQLKKWLTAEEGDVCNGSRSHTIAGNFTPPAVTPERPSRRPTRRE